MKNDGKFVIFLTLGHFLNLGHFFNLGHFLIWDIFLIRGHFFNLGHFLNLGHFEFATFLNLQHFLKNNEKRWEICDIFDFGTFFECGAFF